MKTENNIRKFLIVNSLVTLALTSITIVSFILMYKMSRNAVIESREFIYAYNTEGDIIPMKWVQRRDNVEIEIRHHLQMFVKNFYDLNLQKWESNINKALYLGDFEKIHTHRLNEGYYNKFIQFNVVQEAELYPENIEVDMTDEPYSFRLLIVIKESYGGQTKIFNVFAKGEIKELADRNFPWNPHGLFIENYLEEQIIKVDK